MNELWRILVNYLDYCNEGQTWYAPTEYLKVAMAEKKKSIGSACMVVLYRSGG